MSYWLSICGSFVLAILNFALGTSMLFSGSKYLALVLQAIISEPVTLDKHYSIVSPSFLGWRRANTSKYENNFPAKENCVRFKMCLNFLVNVT